MAKIVLFGCGKGADTAYRYLTKDSDHEVCGFTVEQAFRKTEAFRGLPVVDFESVEQHFPPSEYQMFVVLGFYKVNRLREEKYLAGKKKGYRFVSYVASDLFALEPPSVGENCFILDNQSINPGVKIGNNVVIWSSNHIGDRSVIEDHVWISSHVAIAADAHLGRNSFLGMNVTISNDVRIAPFSYVGPNALITQNTLENGVYIAKRTDRMPNVESHKFAQLIEGIS